MVRWGCVRVSDQLEYFYLKQVKHKPSFHAPPFNSAPLILSFLLSLCYFCPRACPEAWPLVRASEWETLFGTLSLVKNNVIKTARTASELLCGCSSNRADLFRRHNYWSTVLSMPVKVCICAPVIGALLSDLMMRLKHQEAQEETCEGDETQANLFTAQIFVIRFDR